jgi:hypothetical protein
MPRLKIGQPAAAVFVPRFQAVPGQDQDDDTDEMDENIFLLWPNIIGRSRTLPLKIPFNPH